MEKIVLTQSDIEQVTWLDALRIVIVILGGRRRDYDKVGGELVRGANVEAGKSGYWRPNGCCWGSLRAAAGEPRLELLVSAKGH
ncbi:MAG: hypothetical protein JOY53_02410 [Acidobacteriaceae bacterium]|nr:hypothetical protein [Acidobacteriaceae bacterium]